MTLAIAILADRHPDRVGQLAAYLAKSGVKVCIHVDRNCADADSHALRRRLHPFRNVIFSKRIACGWGQFSLVEAELQMCREILDKWDSVTHVQLISGDSLPVRPLARLHQHLEIHPDVDFIESVAAFENNWIVGGLGIERFTLRFPFSWKKQRRRFDLWVSLQRKLRLARRIPADLQPHIGSQWWCLTRKTIEAILNDPDKPRYDAYFRKSWIPDESYFQTLVRKHARKIESHSLMYSHFDHQGKPVIYYDDHTDMLAALDAFFARKIWPGADELYTRFTSMVPAPCYTPDADMHARIAQATLRRRVGRKGLRMIGRSPSPWFKPQPATAARYQVYCGISPVFPDINSWLKSRDLTDAHGRLFASDKAYFANGVTVGVGGLSTSAQIRDNAPECFLRNLVWQQRSGNPAFHFGPMDTEKIEKFIVQDANANVHIVQYGWLLDLQERGITNPDILRVVSTHLLMREKAFIDLFNAKGAQASMTLWTLGQALGNPAPVLLAMLASLGADNARLPLALPQVADAGRALAFARKLKNIGVDIDLRKLDSGTARTARAAIPSVGR